MSDSKALSDNPEFKQWYDLERAQNVIDAYNCGSGSIQPADPFVGMSVVPAATGAQRDFSYIAPDIPIFHAEKCVGCMDCVVECPDTAILAKVVSDEVADQHLATIQDKRLREKTAEQMAVTTKYYKSPEKKGKTPGKFGLFIDPTKCKGCAECVTVCGDKDALSMTKKTTGNLPDIQEMWKFYQQLPDTPSEFINEKVVGDMMLADKALGYTGGAGSCMGCGEGTALRMIMAVTGFLYGNNYGMVCATGCNTVYGSTYPFNPFPVPWTNSLFENAPADAIGVRTRWNQMGWQDKKVFAVGGDGAMLDIGFQSLSRMLLTGLDINAIILDTQVYSNTGGQASTATFHGQEAKMSAHGKAIQGRAELGRKEIGQIAMMHPNVFVLQTTPAHINHMMKGVKAALEYPGPSILNIYTTCQPEHGVADDMAMDQAKLAADCRAFPLFIYDPRGGEKLSDRISLKGNPAVKEDWYTDSKGNTHDFINFAKTEARFAKHFDKEGKPSEVIQQTQAERLANWRLLQELAGLR